MRANEVRTRFVGMSAKLVFRLVTPTVSIAFHLICRMLTTSDLGEIYTLDTVSVCVSVIHPPPLTCLNRGSSPIA
jgi:hypothetical protein